jgi:hypothetical protein
MDVFVPVPRTSTPVNTQSGYGKTRQPRPAFWHKSFADKYLGISRNRAAKTVVGPGAATFMPKASKEAPLAKRYAAQTMPRAYEQGWCDHLPLAALLEAQPELRALLTYRAAHRAEQRKHVEATVPNPAGDAAPTREGRRQGAG